MSGDGDIPPPLPTNWNRCHAYNARKRRYCRQMPIPLTSAAEQNSSQPRYCGNHRHLMTVDDDQSSNEQSNTAKRQRTDEKKKQKDVQALLESEYSKEESKEDNDGCIHQLVWTM